MKTTLIKAIFLLGLTVSLVSSEALGEGSEDKAITDLLNNILIGELFPSGNVYLERIALSGGFENDQHFDGFNFSDQITLFPIKKAKWIRVTASFSRLIKSAYIGAIEKNSHYFRHPFSKPRQEALLYKVEDKITDTPITILAINNYEIEKMSYFSGSDIREYSNKEYEAAMQKIRDDHDSKDKYDTTLSKITEDNTILNARKIALFQVANIDYDVLLSVYNTHGNEYAATVYVIDFIKNGKTVRTKEKYNFDGPY